MTSKQIFDRGINGKSNFLQNFVDVLCERNTPFCIIGGLAVNAYATPLYSEDLDVVVAVDKLNEIIPVLEKKFKVKKYTFGMNVSQKGSKLRIQITWDKRYQEFIKRAVRKNVFGYNLPVASIKDIFQGKIWAASDTDRRPDKRLKDLADIARLTKVKPSLLSGLPEKLKKQIYPRKRNQ